MGRENAMPSLFDIVGPIMTRIYFTGEAVRAKDIRRFVEAALSGIQRLRRGQGRRGRP